MEKKDFLGKTKDILDKLATCIENDLGDSKNAMAIRVLEGDITSPCVLAVAGKVKAGKSFLINALLGVDLAVTGATETTATINVFKKGKPLYPNKPVLCEWTDGTKEWMPRSFLDSMVGTGKDTLNKTAKIDRLIFYIDDNPLLEDVTLVDTPGIGADVGEDGDAHEEHTEAYFKLRKRHQNDTVKLSNSADALIYLFNTVPTETDKTFLQQLYNDGNGLTALNGIGVLSKVDKNLSQIGNIPHFAEEFKKELFTIVPTSAAIQRYMPTKERAVELRDKLRIGFPTEKSFHLAIGSQTAFLYPKVPGCTLPVEERKRIIDSFAIRDLPWSTFALVAKRLYSSDDIDKTLYELNCIGGISNLRNLIVKHFFKRSRMLRANTVLSEMNNMITNIIFSPSFINKEQASEMRDKCIESCKRIQEPQSTIIISLIKENIPTEGSMKAIKNKLYELKGEAEDLRLEMNDANSCYLMYQKVVNNKDEFTEEEVAELSKLLSWHQMEGNLKSRQRYWSAVAAMSAPHSLRQAVAVTAKNRYNKLILQKS